jgi:ABC-type polar amino acid transport system ATPase subunit
MLNVTNLTKKFGELTAVNDLGFSVAKGQAAKITHLEDTGKSVLMKSLHPLEDENWSGFPFTHSKNDYFTKSSSLKQDDDVKENE